MKTLILEKNSVLRKNKFMEVANNAYKSLLKRIQGNREINKAHVEEMKESVKRNGILRDVIVCILNGVYYIVDGQHLAQALFELGEKIPCKIVDCKNPFEMVQLMIDLNTTSKGWSLTEYINSWAWYGKSDYKKLQKTIQDSKTRNYVGVTQETVIMMALSQNANRTELTKQTKTGEFKIGNPVLGPKLLRNVFECTEYIQDSRPTNQALITLMIKEGKDYNHAQFIKNLKALPKNVEAINATRKESEVLSMLKSTYKGKKITLK